MLVVDEFQSAVVATPLWVTTYFGCHALVVVEVVSVFEYGTEPEFECTVLFIPIERVEVVPDETVKVVAVVTSAPISGQ